MRLSIGEAIRKVLNFQPYTELARQINLHLKAGNPVPDELAVQALEVALLDMQCQTRGYDYTGIFVYNEVKPCLMLTSLLQPLFCPGETLVHFLIGEPL